MVNYALYTYVFDFPSLWIIRSGTSLPAASVESNPNPKGPEASALQISSFLDPSYRLSPATLEEPNRNPNPNRTFSTFTSRPLRYDDNGALSGHIGCHDNITATVPLSALYPDCRPWTSSRVRVHVTLLILVSLATSKP